jgi:hypothetical protein
MFSNSSLFRNIPCPNGPEKCKLPNCIFSHVKKPNASEAGSSLTGYEVGDASGDAKRRKLGDGTKQTAVSCISEPQPKIFNEPFTGALAGKPTAAKSEVVWKRPETQSKDHGTQRTPVTATRPISPPPSKKTSSIIQNVGSKAEAKKNNERAETLNPRIVSKVPAGHAIRYQLLKKLYEEMQRLNNEVAKSSEKETSLLHLTNNELIRAALDEEEHTALGQTSVYVNILKQRIMAYKRMSIHEWKDHRQKIKKSEEKHDAQPTDQKPAGPVQTGLSNMEELVMLKRLVLKPKEMEQAGFVTVPPTQEEIEDAKKTAEMSANWEVCERCTMRFQVFPDRREDGALTSNGKCVYHWGKPFAPKREKTDLLTGASRDKIMSCCNEKQGTPGCITGDTHVFKTSSPKRLALVLPFECTPTNPNVDKDLAVSFDCEMGYTTHGLELIRLSATTWPQGEPLIDVLVRPIGHILDLNTRFSGVSPEQFLNAESYDPAQEPALPSASLPNKVNGTTQMPQKLRAVSSPAVARSLLCSYISPDTVLIGHAIDNDLNVVRLVHPTIVDTSLLYAHPAGLPIRYGLRKLAKDFLNLDIQTAGAAGHDSLEDSRATGELVRAKIAREWTALKNRGWEVKYGVFSSPDGPGSLPKYEKTQGHLSKKRKSSASLAGNLQVGGTVSLAEHQGTL